MHEILDHLPDGAKVLDLGCKGGSFAPSDYPHLVVICADIEKPGSGQISRFVQADAAALPFPPGFFDAIILNHCLEHFGRLKPALQEIGRCINRRGAIFVAVPDAKTVTDRFYRKLYYNSGGHVNLFGSDDDLSKMLSWYFGLPHVGTTAERIWLGSVFWHYLRICGPNSPPKCLRPLRHGQSSGVVDSSRRGPETLDILQSLSLPGLWRDEPLQPSCAV